jgi:hypothetical protein
MSLDVVEESFRVRVSKRRPSPPIEELTENVLLGDDWPKDRIRVRAEMLPDDPGPVFPGEESRLTRPALWKTGDPERCIERHQ